MIIPTIFINVKIAVKPNYSNIVWERIRKHTASYSEIQHCSI